MKSVRSIGVTAIAAAMTWAGVMGVAGRARAAVLDQVPDNAMLVFEIKNLDELNTKISKTADMVGLTATVPELKDPISAIEDSLGITDKGINKSSDMAVALFVPGTTGVTATEPQGMFIIPVSDYQAFLGNFTGAKDDGGGITEGQDKFHETVYVAHWGEYAAVAEGKQLLAKPPTGIKLTGVAAEELKKDAIIYLNMDAVRSSELPKVTDHRADTLKEMMDMQNDAPTDHLKNMLKAFDNLGLDEYKEVLQDTKYAVISANLTDDGIATAVAAEFIPDSKFGKLAAQCKGTDQPMLTGLPDRKYFVLMGFMNSPALKAQFAETILDPIAKAFDAGGDDAKPLGAIVKAATDQWNGINSVASGLAVPDQLGKDGMIESVQVVSGDSATLKKGYSAGFDAMNELFKAAIPAGQGGVSFTIKPDAATVDDVHFDQYTLKIDAGPGGLPPAMVMNTIFGSNGPGGYIGAVNDKTLLQITGVDDQSALIADTVASAKTGKDVLTSGKSIQSVVGLLPKQRAAVGFVYFDQIISTGVKMGQMFGAPVKIHVPADLPPVGITLSSDGIATMRVDVIFPTPLVQAMVGVVTDLRSGFMGGPGGPGGGL